MKALLALAMVQACTASSTPTAPIPRSSACQEQADAWCQVIDPSSQATAGCHTVYLHWCGMEGVIRPEAQNACLDDIAMLPPTPPIFGYGVPDSCSQTWATPP